MIGAGFAEVLHAAQTGDEAAFAVLWRDANPPLVRYLRVLDPDTAEDVAAETWVSVVRGLPGFRGDELAWRGWLFTIARRRGIDDLRRRLRHPTSPLDRPDGSGSDGIPAGPAGGVRAIPTGGIRAVPADGRYGGVAADAAEEALGRLDTRAALELVASLPPLQAEVIVLRVVAGLPVEAVAGIVGRSPGAVRVAAHRGLRTLAQVLARGGVTQ